VTRTENLVKFGPVVFEICEQTDKQTDRQTDTLITIPCSVIVDGLKINLTIKDEDNGHRIRQTEITACIVY